MSLARGCQRVCLQNLSQLFVFVDSCSKLSLGACFEETDTVSMYGINVNAMDSDSGPFSLMKLWYLWCLPCLGPKKSDYVCRKALGSKMRLVDLVDWAFREYQ